MEPSYMTYLCIPKFEANMKQSALIFTASIVLSTATAAQVSGRSATDCSIFGSSVEVVENTPERDTVFIIKDAESDGELVVVDGNAFVLQDNTLNDRTLIAFKTNLLFDVLATPNITMEVPIGNHFSLGFEWMFPWWLTHANDYCYEALSGSVAFKYYFQKQTRTKNQVDRLRGWYLGLYGGTGRYDFQNTEKGVQGKFWDASLIAGYLLPISKSLGLEFALGFGYVVTEYKSYIPRETYTILDYQHTSRQYIWTPTKAEVSLVYRFFGPSKKQPSAGEYTFRTSADKFIYKVISSEKPAVNTHSDDTDAQYFVVQDGDYIENNANK